MILCNVVWEQMYQSLGSDLEADGNEQWRKLGIPFCKVIQTTINLTDLFLAVWSQESLSLIDFNLENMTKCNIIFSDLDYFLELLLVEGCRPIANSEPKWVNPLE